MPRQDLPPISLASPRPCKVGEAETVRLPGCHQGPSCRDAPFRAANSARCSKDQRAGNGRRGRLEVPIAGPARHGVVGTAFAFPVVLGVRVGHALAWQQDQRSNYRGGPNDENEDPNNVLGDGCGVGVDGAEFALGRRTGVGGADETGGSANWRRHVSLRVHSAGAWASCRSWWRRTRYLSLVWGGR